MALYRRQHWMLSAPSLSGTEPSAPASSLKNSKQNVSPILLRSAWRMLSCKISWRDGRWASCPWLVPRYGTDSLPGTRQVLNTGRAQLFRYGPFPIVRCNSSRQNCASFDSFISSCPPLSRDTIFSCRSSSCQSPPAMQRFASDGVCQRIPKLLQRVAD